MYNLFKYLVRNAFDKSNLELDRDDFFLRQKASHIEDNHFFHPYSYNTI